MIAWRTPHVVAALVAGGALALLGSWLYSRRPRTDDECRVECALARQRATYGEWQPPKPQGPTHWESDVGDECRPRCITLMDVYP